MLEWGILGALINARSNDPGGHGVDFSGFSLGAVRFRRLYRVRRDSHAVHQERGVHPEESFIFRFANKHLRITRDYKGEHFFVRNKGKIYATPLFLVLLVVEITDITLAIDSIPAIFGITQDPSSSTPRMFRNPGPARHVFLLAACFRACGS